MPDTHNGIPHEAVKALAQALWDDDADRSGTPEDPVEEYEADALRMLAPAARIIAEHIALLVEKGCPEPDAPEGHGCDYPLAARIVRDAFKEERHV